MNKIRIKNIIWVFTMMLLIDSIYVKAGDDKPEEASDENKKDSDPTDHSYNIITFDGGGIKGIITAACLIEVERYAYHYAKDIRKY